MTMYLQSFQKKAKLEDVSELSEVDLNEPCSAYDRATRMGTTFFLTTMSRAGIKRRFITRYGSILKELYKNNKSSSCWFLNEIGTQDKRMVLHYVVGCPDREVRNIVGELISIALANIAPHETKSWELKEEVDLGDSKGDTEGDDQDAKQIPKEATAGGIAVRADKRGYCIGVLKIFFKYMNVIQRWWKYFIPFFQILADALNLGPEVLAYMNREELLPKLLDLYFWDLSPKDLRLVGNLQHRKTMCDDHNETPDMRGVLKAIHNLLSQTSFDKLPDNAKEFLRREIFYLTPYFQGRDTTDRKALVVEIYKLVALNDEMCFEAYAKAQRRLLGDVNHQQMRAVWRVLEAVISSKEGVFDQKQRIDKLLVPICDYCVSTSTQEQTKSRPFKMYDLCVEMLLRLAKKERLVFEWLHGHPEVTSWMQKFCLDPNKYINQFEREFAYKYSPYTKDAYYRTLDKSYKFLNSYAFTSSSLFAPHSTNGKVKAQQAKQIFEGDYDGLDRPVDGYDSDDEREFRTYKVNDEVDVMDNEGKWLAAYVTRILSKPGAQYQEIEVDYVNYHQGQWAEILFSRSAKIAPRGSLSKFERSKR
jgi:hypothetical protein